MPDILKLTPSESLEIRSSTPEALEVEATYGPGGSPPPRHFHPAQDERFEVLSGSIRARVDGEERDLSPGETIDIGRARAIDAMHRQGRVGRDGMPSPLAFAVLIGEYRDVFRLAGPDLLLRPALAALAIAGRARGYTANP